MKFEGMRPLLVAVTMSASTSVLGQNVFVETMRLGSESGAKRPEYSAILRSQLATGGVKVVPPDKDQSGEERLPAKPPADLYVVTSLVLKHSKLDLTSICQLMASSSRGAMTTGASLKDPAGQTTPLKDANVDVLLTKADVNCNRMDLTSAAAQRLMRDALAPLANQVMALVKK